jgi:hypothetical protein
MLDAFHVRDITFIFWPPRKSPFVQTHLATIFLEERFEDYLTLSKILWHRDVETRINVYGVVSMSPAGCCRVAEWALPEKQDAADWSS